MRPRHIFMFAALVAMAIPSDALAQGKIGTVKIPKKI